MRYDVFEKIILDIKTLQEISKKFYDLGLDLSNVEDGYSKIITNLLGSHYSEEGLEWIEWFLYERILLNGEINIAEDVDGNSICYDVKSLWLFVEEIRNSKDFKDFIIKRPMSDEERTILFKKLFTK